MALMKSLILIYWRLFIWLLKKILMSLMMVEKEAISPNIGGI